MTKLFVSLWVSIWLAVRWAASSGVSFDPIACWPLSEIQSLAGDDSGPHCAVPSLKSNLNEVSEQCFTSDTPGLFQINLD